MYFIVSSEALLFKNFWRAFSVHSHEVVQYSLSFIILFNSKYGDETYSQNLFLIWRINSFSRGYYVSISQFSFHSFYSLFSRFLNIFRWRDTYLYLLNLRFSHSVFSFLFLTVNIESSVVLIIYSKRIESKHVNKRFFMHMQLTKAFESIYVLTNAIISIEYKLR